MDTCIQHVSVLGLDRADLQEVGVDSTRLDDATFRYVAAKLVDALFPAYWESLKALTEDIDLPRLTHSNS